LATYAYRFDIVAQLYKLKINLKQDTAHGARRTVIFNALLGNENFHTNKSQLGNKIYHEIIFSATYK
jgi:hypothetical protein